MIEKKWHKLAAILHKKAKNCNDYRTVKMIEQIFKIHPEIRIAALKEFLKYCK